MVGGSDMTEGSEASLILNSVDSKRNGVLLSPEDVAWADSCLISDPETSESNWNSLKFALLDILSSQHGRDGSSGGTNIKIPPSSEGTETSHNLESTVADILPFVEEAEKNNDHLINEKTDTFWSTNLVNAFLPTYEEERTIDDIFPINEAADKNSDDHLINEKNSDDHLVNEKTDTLWSRTNLENAFLPTYKEDPTETEYSDAMVDLGFPSFVMDPSTEGIFEVWDLEIPAVAEEDELIKQLSKALSENSLQPAPLTSDDSGLWKDLKEESVDDLISGIADLSLN